MISVRNIRIPTNYILLKPDPHHETYQLAGHQTDILAPTYAYQGDKRIDAKHKNFSTTGTVYGVPERIRFTRDDIKDISASIVTERNGENAIADSSLLYKVNRLKEAGCRYETENELSIGDKVKFSYRVHLKAQYFDTEEGEMMFVKYDDIFCVVDGKMINGFILIDPEKKDVVIEGGLIYTPHKSGLVLPKLGDTYKRSARWAHGYVLKAGKPIKGYFDFADYNDEEIELAEGEHIIYDPRTALQFESQGHMELADRKLYLIQRKDILFLEKENLSNFEKLCMI